MTSPAPIHCIGSVLWDIVGRSDRHMKAGHDVPGRIIRIPGGVMMNIAMALRMHDVPVSLLTSLGADPAGRDLLQEATQRGMETALVHISDSHPTDQYMAIEGSNGLIAAIADAHSLEAEADAVIAPMRDGRVGTVDAPYDGMIVCEGNLPQATLDYMSGAAEFSMADVRLAPASPGKAERLKPFFKHSKATFYVNLIEANILLGTKLATAPEAAAAMVDAGVFRAAVTDGPNMTAIADDRGVQSALPPAVTVLRVTGAGDVFMASHIAADMRGLTGAEALDFALTHTATYISTETSL
ncbi:PfkB family carbohydrate kinase [Amylibacter sp. IMCC11727]|uniref:PfkB family carbohydrate kinase n=1 Tax=Amylibacter sp. IMCC11727 TaxID=3039851 RepID=UPI00244E1F4D|nr:PfkB family carbohydrate kinase [Amylibacter sp. IMCC11727]WGI20380.1 PfkB family carbohydrate kinase [Amylibacter sp. IMCC11727]